MYRLGEPNSVRSFQLEIGSFLQFMDRQFLDTLLLDTLGNKEFIHLLEEISDEQTPKEEEILYCANCQYKITTHQEKTVVGDSHSHHLTNPYGIAFNVGCFNNAPGCVVFGELTSAYTWFPNYYWQYAHCRNCHIHIGWLFSSSSQHRFFGLILDKLASC